MFILIIGDIANGLRFLGPFEDREFAQDYSTVFFRGHDWIVVELEEPPNKDDLE